MIDVSTDSFVHFSSLGFFDISVIITQLIFCGEICSGSAIAIWFSMTPNVSLHWDKLIVSDIFSPISV
jgi:hypothetical protein